MEKIILMLSFLFWGSMATEAQISKTERVKEIRGIYADVKQRIAENGKNGMAPLDVTMNLSEGTVVSEDLTIDDMTEVKFHFSKYRINAELDYPDASSCYFVSMNRWVNGHNFYREILFDPNEGCLLFSYLRGETHAGFVVESRYYYAADGTLVEQKHKVGGHEATADDHTWSTADDDKELAMMFLDIFDALMNPEKAPASETGKTAGYSPDQARMKLIRSTYAAAKEKIASDEKSEIPRTLNIVVRDQSFGPPETREIKYYFDEGEAQQQVDAGSLMHCYFISEHNSHMGFDNYAEYLFDPQADGLIFSYNRGAEEGQTFEWRYYFDKDGKCIEAKTNQETHDNGTADKRSVRTFMNVYKKLCDAVM